MVAMVTWDAAIIISMVTLHLWPEYQRLRCAKSFIVASCFGQIVQFVLIPEKVLTLSGSILVMGVNHGGLGDASLEKTTREHHINRSRKFSIRLYGKFTFFTNYES